MTIQNKIGAYRSGSWYQRDPKTITKITVHHSAIPHGNYSNNEDLLKFIQGIHEGHGWPGLAYHFVIAEDGTIFQTNDFKDVTWHDTQNWDSVGVLVNGYFHPDVNDKPTKQQLASLDWLLDNLCTQHPEFPADHDDVLAHRERSATACPGDGLYPYVVEYREKNGSVEWGNPEEDDGSMVGGDEPQDCSEVKEELVDMRTSRDKWKRMHKELEEKHEKEIKERNEDYERLQKTNADQTLTITNLQQDNARLSELYGKSVLSEEKVKEERDAILEVKRSLESTVETLKAHIKSLEEDLKAEKSKVKKKIMTFTWWERFTSLFRKKR